jgi:ABC-type transporter Mla maintaining outer membrane lipid asymmetry permease subunit MlaE
MAFDPTRVSSDRNRARPLTAAQAFVHAEAKSKIMMAKNARRTGFLISAAGLFELARFPSALRSAVLTVTFPGRTPIGLTGMQVIGLVALPVGLVIGITGFFVYRKYMRAAISDPATAGIFDPSVEWPERV